MRKLAFIFFLLLLLACQSNRQQQKKSIEKQDGIAKFEIQKEFHNFGMLQEGEIVSYPFWFKNTGDAPLRITGSETDCECIQLAYAEDTTAPGDSSFVEVLYNSAGDIGRQLKTLTLFVNSKKKKIQLYITANVKSELIEINN